MGAKVSLTSLFLFFAFKMGADFFPGPDAMQKLPQPAEPFQLLGPTDRGIASARRRQDEDCRSAKGLCLLAEMAAASGKKFIDPLAVEGYHSRLGLTKLLE